MLGCTEKGDAAKKCLATLAHGDRNELGLRLWLPEQPLQYAAEEVT
jgi:hypothetical protein